MRLSFPPLKSFAVLGTAVALFASAAWARPAGTASQLAISGVSGVIYTSGSPGVVTVTVEDSTGAVVTTSTAAVSLAITSTAGFAQTLTATAAAGVAAVDASSLVLANGTYTLTASSAGLTSAAVTLVVETGSTVLPTTAVGSSSAAQTIAFAFDAPTVVSSAAVLFQGAPNLDFTLGSGSTCVGTLAANAICTVPVVFTPRAPGRRLGVVELLGATGTVLQTVFISGTGSGAAMNFSPGQTISLGTNVDVPVGFAFDAQGNLYIANYPSGNDSNTEGDIIKLPSINGVLSTADQTLFGSGLNYPDGLAFDGAGNLYVADDDENEVIEAPAGGGPNIILLANPAGSTTYSTLNNPGGLAVDGAGDLFICDYSNNRVLELLNHNGSFDTANPVVLGNGLSNPDGVKVDASGNLIVADWGNGRVVEIPLQNGVYNSAAQTTLIDTGDGQPGDVALDPAGDLYIGLEDTNTVEVVPNQGGSYNPAAAYVIAQGLNDPDAVLLDSQGNIYYCDTDDGIVYEANTVTPPSLSFPDTSVGLTSASQAVPVLNTGNLPLSISSISFDPAFPNQGSTCAGNLAAGESCNLVTAFAPNALGTDSTAAVITAAAVNQPTGTETVPLSGVGDQGTQTIALTSPGPLTYGAAPITLESTGGGSGIPVTFTLVSGPATLSNGVLTLTGAGNVVIDANQAGNNLYAAAPQVSETLVVAPAILTVTAANATMAFGAALPTFTATITGYVNGDSSAVVKGAPALSTSATSASSVGTYPITAAYGTLATANYNFVFVSGTLTINIVKSTATWTPASNSLVYGQALGAAELDGSSSVAGTWTYANGKAPVGVNSTLPVGSYNLTATLVPNDTADYTTVTVSANITITPAVLTVTAASVNIGYGLAIPTLTYTITGFVNGDAAGVVTGVPALTTTAALLSPAGSYPISISTAGMSAANYTFTTVAATLTIGLATPPTSWVPTVGSTFVYGPTLGVFWDATSTVAGSWSYKFNGASGVTTATYLPVGSWQVEATFSPTDTNDYTSVTLDQNFTVTKATLTFTAASASMVYGAAVPALSYTESGFQGSDTAANASSGAPVLATTASSTANVGTYPVTISLTNVSSGNYTAVGVAGAITVTAATPTVSLAAGSLTYGQSLASALAATANVPGTWTFALSGSSGAIPAQLPVGTYSIIGTFAPTSANYISVSTPPVTVTVSPAALTVTANNASMVSGAALPTLGYTISGFVGTDTAASAVTGAATVTTTATTSSPAGTYPITAAAGSLAAANYSFTFVPGTLTVTAAATLPYTTSTSVSHNLNQVSYGRGATIWFNARFDANGVADGTIIAFQNVTLTFTANRQTLTIPVPSATITFSAAATQATTSYDAATQTWNTVAPVPHETDNQQLHHGYDHGASWGGYGSGQYFNGGFDGQADYGNLFLDGIAEAAANLPSNVEDVTWSGTIASNNASATIHWDWSAAVYSSFSTNYNAFGVIGSGGAPSGHNFTGDVAGTPENYSRYLENAITGGNGSQGLDNGWGENCGDRTSFPLKQSSGGSNNGGGGNNGH